MGGKHARLHSLGIAIQIYDELRLRHQWISTTEIADRFAMSHRQALRYLRCIQTVVPVVICEKDMEVGARQPMYYWKWMGHHAG